MIARIGVRAVLLIAVVATIGCDRVTKHVARAALAGEPGRSYLANTIRLEYVENAGGFLSLGASLPSSARTALFTLGTGVMLLTLVGAAVRFRWRGWLLIGTSLVLAGGASNWVDRLVRGSVVDFLTSGWAHYEQASSMWQTWRSCLASPFCCSLKDAGATMCEPPVTARDKPPNRCCTRRRAPLARRPVPSPAASFGAGEHQCVRRTIREAKQANRAEADGDRTR